MVRSVLVLYRRRHQQHEEVDLISERVHQYGSSGSNGVAERDRRARSHLFQILERELHDAAIDIVEALQKLDVDVLRLDYPRTRTYTHVRDGYARLFSKKRSVARASTADGARLVCGVAEDARGSEKEASIHPRQPLRPKKQKSAQTDLMVFFKKKARRNQTETHTMIF